MRAQHEDHRHLSADTRFRTLGLITSANRNGTSMKLRTWVVGGLALPALIGGSTFLASPVTFGLTPKGSAASVPTAPTDTLQLHCTMQTQTNGMDDYAYRVALGVTTPDGHIRKRFFKNPPVGV